MSRFFAALCAFEMVLFGVSAVGIAPPTPFSMLSADGALTLAWFSAMCGWWCLWLEEKRNLP